jgi:predicted DCC family thiol-disulfide oxidoreductase YuxK
MYDSTLPNGKKIILFDGVCNLCDSSVNFIIKHDKKDTFRFVSLQSDLGKKIITYLVIDNIKIDSIVLYDPGKGYYFKSQAILKIINVLGGWFLLFKIANILPKYILDLIYDYVALNRYKWFGKKESCILPNPEIRVKFLN